MTSDLPVHAVLPDLLAALRTSGAAVLVAPPGAGKTTTELAKIGFMLFDYCYDSVSDRAKKAREIEKRVSSLQRSVESHQ